MTDRNLTLLTDFYQLTMMNGYLKQNKKDDRKSSSEGRQQTRRQQPGAAASQPAPASANASSSVYTFAGGDVRTLSVTCNVYVKENLASDEWKLAKSERITVGGEAAEIDAGEAGAASGFYKVEVVK